jgi:hypothetical protein
MIHKVIATAAAGWLLSVAAVTTGGAPAIQAEAAQRTQAPAVTTAALFDTAHNCMACHNSLSTSAGEDISIGTAWRATMMANSARDPYWHAAVRREILDHPAAAADIEDECSICHMPMARTTSMALGRRGEIFAHLPVGGIATPQAVLAADGVSCTACHQITADKLGTPDSFTGGFVIDTSNSTRPRSIFGPFPVQAGQAGIMHSATGFAPVESPHVRQSELCATCHTLYTHPLSPTGEQLGRFPEQVPYLEWRHSAYAKERSCQACHMPVVEEPTRMSSVLGEVREGVARHNFLGGNFFMLGMLNRYRTELGVEATTQELDAAVRDTLEHLRTGSASLAIERAELSGGRLAVDVHVANLAGHKLPTGYPSRRAWIHLAVRDRSNAVVFESGAITPEGRIVGNDNDDDPAKYEPHHVEIRSRDQVQIYESIMGDPQGAVTTGLLKGVSYLKDNRLLPRGFDKATAHADVAVYGAARQDASFSDAGDRVRYDIDPGGGSGPFVVEARLLFQPIAFRWAQNLVPYDAPETQRFVGYYNSMAASSSALLATARADVR